MARSCKKFPDRIVSKLNKREEKCKMMLERELGDEGADYESPYINFIQFSVYT